MEEAYKRIGHAIATGETTLDLSYLDLTSLPKNIFTRLTNLKILDLSFNHLTSLPEKIFVPLVNLQKLSICDNLLTSLPEKIFPPPNQLAIIRHI